MYKKKQFSTITVGDILGKTANTKYFCDAQMTLFISDNSMQDSAKLQSATCSCNSSLFKTQSGLCTIGTNKM